MHYIDSTRNTSFQFDIKDFIGLRISALENFIESILFGMHRDDYNDVLNKFNLLFTHLKKYNESGFEYPVASMLNFTNSTQTILFNLETKNFKSSYLQF